METTLNHEKGYWSALVSGQQSHKATNPSDITRISSYYFIFNCSSNEIEYVNNSFEQLIQEDKSCFTIQKLLDMIHPDDISYFMDCEARGLKFTNTLLYNEHFRYLMSYSYRVQAKSGTYIHIRQQCQAIEVNEQGHLTKTFVTHQQIDPPSIRTEEDYYIFDKNKNQILNPKNYYNLTKREREIFDLIQDGLNSKQIAEKLFSSKYTIDTHRKNILKKTNAKNFVDLTLKLNSLQLL